MTILSTATTRAPAMTTAAGPGPGTGPAPRRRVATTVGILFVVQMISAMFGTSLIQGFVDGDSDRAGMTVGVLLMMCSGIAVVGIGLLMYPVLREVGPRLAVWYPILRITECV